MKLFVFLLVATIVFACNSEKNVEETKGNGKWLTNSKQHLENEELSDTSSLQENKKKTEKEFDQEAVKLNQQAYKIYEESFMSSQKEVALLDSGLILVNKAIEIDSTYSPSYKTKGGILILLKRNDEAVEVLKKLIEVDNNPEYIMTLGNYYDSFGLEDEANQQYEKALTTFKRKLTQCVNRKDSINLQEGVARLLSFMGKKEDALNFIDSLIIANPDIEILKSLKEVIKSFDRRAYFQGN